MPTLDEQLAEFRRRIDKLEDQAKKASGALQLAPHQVGPRPGWFRAARIEGAQMILDFSASQTGVSPRISVTDTAGVTRAEMGNLANYTGPNGTNSPAQYGFRANDGSGNAIFDSLGLIAVMKLLGSVTNTVGDMQVGTGLYQVALDSTVTFSLTRPATVLGLAAVNINATAASAPQTAILVDGVQSDANGPTIYCTNNVTAPLGMTPFAVTSLATGAHALALGISIALGQTWVASTYYLYVFLLGG